MFLLVSQDRVIVHRLEQISVCVLKGMWPGRKHNPAPPPPAMPAEAMLHGGVERPPMEHSYAGDFMGSKYMVSSILISLSLDCHSHLRRQISSIEMYLSENAKLGIT